MVQKSIQFFSAPLGQKFSGTGYQVKRGCAVFQACEHPNSASKGRYEMTPIPPAQFLSVCLDIFSLTELSWQKSIQRFISPLCGPAQWMDDSPTNVEKGINSRKMCASIARWWIYPDWSSNHHHIRPGTTICGSMVSNYVWEARHSKCIFTGLSSPGKR